MLRRLWALLVPLWMAFLAFVPAGHAAARLLTPFDGAVVHSPDVLLVYVVPAQADTVIQLDGELREVRDVAVPGNDEDLHHVRLTLTEGRHRVRVLTRSSESELAAATITYIPHYSLRTAAAAGDRRYFFHTRDREATCSECHSLPAVFETVPDHPLAPAGKVCGACHPGVESTPVLHGPVAVYACFKCHEPEYEPARFAQKTSQSAMCSACHAGFLSRILGGKEFVHGPVAAGGCMVCHDPHGGQTQALTRAKSPELCLFCHSDTLPLPVERGIHGSVPCTGCHDPHGGRTRIFHAAEGNALCAKCHADVAGSQAGHPVAGHPVAAETDPSKAGRKMTCLSCHGPHAIDDISRADIEANNDLQRKFCRKCHY